MERAWELLDSGPIPDDDGVMEMLQRGNEIVIRVNGRELMCNMVHGSEDELANLACERLTDRPAARVLIGGLGMGFTLAAALNRLGKEAEVVVAELVPAVIRWNRGVLSPEAGHPTFDPRTIVHEGDVAALIRAEPAAWDAILLDVDNGPTGLTRSTNCWLYDWEGLDAVHTALRPGGILGVWSAWPDRGFTRRVERAGFDVVPLDVRERGSAGGRMHTVWIATRRDQGSAWKARDEAWESSESNG